MINVRVGFGLGLRMYVGSSTRVKVRATASVNIRCMLRIKVGARVIIDFNGLAWETGVCTLRVGLT